MNLSKAHSVLFPTEWKTPPSILGLAFELKLILLLI